MKKNIILIGFMGSGKTTVGQILANRLRYQFVDTDELIETEAGMSITEIFAKVGEEGFRQMESDLLVELNKNLNHAIISTGGGLPLREENASLLKMLGRVAFLKVTKEEVLARLEGDTTRPLLAGENAEQKVEDLLNIRNPIYKSASHVIIEVAGRTPEQVADEVELGLN